MLATDVDRERLFLDLDLERDLLNLASETELDFFLRVADFDLDFLVFTTDLERDFLTRVIDFERDRFFLVVDFDLDFLRSFDRECERADLLARFEGESRFVDVDREFESSVFNKDLERERLLETSITIGDCVTDNFSCSQKFTISLLSEQDCTTSASHVFKIKDTCSISAFATGGVDLLESSVNSECSTECAPWLKACGVVISGKTGCSSIHFVSSHEDREDGSSCPNSTSKIVVVGCSTTISGLFKSEA